MLTLLIILLIFLLICKIKEKTKSSTHVHVVSFAHNCCEKAQKNLEETAFKYGATNVFSLNIDTLEAPDDVKEYIKNNKRGSGYWIWKPYALKHVLSRTNPGDIVIYVDASTFFEDSMQTIVNFINKNSILCFKHEYSLFNYYSQNNWTKKNAVEHFGYNDEWHKTDGLKTQIMGTFVGVKNDTLGHALVNTWLDVLTPNKSHLFDDSESHNNCKEFIESRHDQQILSLILYKYLSHINFPETDPLFGWIFHSNINGNNRHD